jgi:hypothetical protein
LNAEGKENSPTQHQQKQPGDDISAVLEMTHHGFCHEEHRKDISAKSLPRQSSLAGLFFNQTRDRRFHSLPVPSPRGKKIRVNAVAPGPIWTPLIPSTFPANEVATFGSDTPLGRAGEPEEVATCFVFLASDDSSCTTGQVLHPNGGRVVNG